MAYHVTMEVEGHGLCVKVEVTDDGLSWASDSATSDAKDYVERKQILATELINDTTVCVHYIKVVLEKKRVHLRKEVVTFTGTVADMRDIDTNIRDILNRHETKRPKKLLVFINPMGGWRAGYKVYQTQVAPLLKICGIVDDCIVTDDGDHSQRTLETYDLSSIDGVLCVGGDGSLNRIIRALVLRTTAEAGVDINHPGIILPSPAVAVGQLPTGSANVVTHFANGSLDIETCLLPVLMGHTKPLDVMTLHNDGKFVHTTNLMAGIGMNSTIFHWFERLRWMAKSRYLLTLPICVVAWKKYDVEIDFLPADDNVADLRDADKVEKVSGANDIVDGPSPGWMTYRGRAADVGVIQYALRDYYHLLNNKDYRPPDMANGSSLLVISKFTSFCAMLRTVRILKTRGRRFISSEQIVHIPVKECRIKFLSNQNTSKGKAKSSFSSPIPDTETARLMTETTTSGVPDAETSAMIPHDIETTTASSKSEVNTLTTTRANSQPTSSRQTLCLNDGDVFPLPNGPRIESKVHRGLINFYCVDTELVVDAQKKALKNEHETSQNA